MKFSTILTILAVAIPVGILYESGSHEQTPKSVNDLLKSEISMEVHTDLPAPVRKPAIAERPVDTEEDGWTRVTQVATTPRKPVAQAIPLDVISWDMQEEDWHYSNVMDDQYDVEAQIAVEAQLQEEVQAGLNNLMSMFKEVSWSQFSATALAEDMLISQNTSNNIKRKPVKAPKPQAEPKPLVESELLSLLPVGITKGQYRVVDNHGFVGTVTVTRENISGNYARIPRDHYQRQLENRTIHFVRLNSTMYVPTPAQQEAVALPALGEFLEALYRSYNQVR